MSLVSDNIGHWTVCATLVLTFCVQSSIQIPSVSISTW